MQQYEYRVVPAPQRGEKAKGARSTAERFAAALMAVMNDLGRDGWEYLRADTLPCEERVGLTGRSSSFQHMLVFRRALPVRGQASAGAAPIAGPQADAAVPRITPFAKPVIVPVAAPSVAGPSVAAPAPVPVSGPSTPSGPARGPHPASD